MTGRRVEVHLGSWSRPGEGLLGPLPARRLGDVVAFEVEAPEEFEPWPGRSRVERRFALLDLGVAFGQPCWHTWRRPGRSTVEIPAEQRDSWYVDLVTVEHLQDGGVVLRDLYVDVMLGPGLVPRTLDLDELADACEVGTITVGQLVDGLRRWQRFLDRHLHASRFPERGLTDFPPAAIRPLAAVEGLFGPPVRWPATRSSA
jgi:hypothetical protein